MQRPAVVLIGKCGDVAFWGGIFVPLSVLVGRFLDDASSRVLTV
jgi:hypothetical protein